MTPNGNQPAYPSEVSIGPDPRMGLTKREAFAMAAMQGLVRINQSAIGKAGIAEEAAAYADALLAALERTSKP